MTRAGSIAGRLQNAALRPVRVIAGLTFVASLFLAREVLVPFALAMLLTFLLDPLVRVFQRIGLHRVLAVIITVLCFTGVVGAIGLLVGEQIVELSIMLPDYRQNLRDKVRHLRGSDDGAITRLTGTLKELQQELATTVPATAAAAKAPSSEPVKVEVVNQGPSLPSVISSLVGPVMVPVVGAGITWLLLVFLLLYIDDVRARMLTYAGMRRVGLTTAALNEIGVRVGRFVRMQLITNLSYGVMVGIGLSCFGLPQALLWGVLSFLLRFAPYVGPWTGAALPTLVAIAVFPGWSLPIGVICMFLAIEGLTNLVLEPWLYGSGTGITSLGVIVGTVFWSWVWGPMGLLLAVPMTVCLTVMGKYVPQLSLLNQLFGEDASVSTAGQLYQSLLVGDAPAADRVLDQELEHALLETVCDEVLLPILAELKRDVSADAVDPLQAHQAMRTLEAVLTAAVPMGLPISPVRMICISGQNDADACAARLLVMCCRARGVGAETVSSQVLVSEAVDYVGRADISQVVVVQVAPISIPHWRRLMKALLPKLGEEARLIHVTVGTSEGTHLGDADAERVTFEHSFAAIVAPLAEQETIETPTQV